MTDPLIVGRITQLTGTGDLIKLPPGTGGLVEFLPIEHCAVISSTQTDPRDARIAQLERTFDDIARLCAESRASSALGLRWYLVRIESLVAVASIAAQKQTTAREVQV